MVKANGIACRSVTESPRMAVFQCSSLHPNTSYNITAVDSDGHVYSLSCMTSNHKETIGELKLFRTSYAVKFSKFLTIYELLW